MSLDRLAADLPHLGRSDAETLCRRWRAVFGASPPATLPRWLTRGLAYHIQGDALGTLDRETARSLDRLARTGEPIPLSELKPIKPGTLLVREWEGTLQRVMVLDEGFAWNGGTYPSPSAVVFLIIVEGRCRGASASVTSPTCHPTGPSMSARSGCDRMRRRLHHMDQCSS